MLNDSAKELSYAEEQFRKETKIVIDEEVKRGDYATKKDIKELEIKIEKGFKEVIVWGCRSNGRNWWTKYSCYQAVLKILGVMDIFNGI